jgi:hypothetical protein
MKMRMLVSVFALAVATALVPVAVHAQTQTPPAKPQDPKPESKPDEAKPATPATLAAIPLSKPRTAPQPPLFSAEGHLSGPVTFLWL